MPRLRLDPSEVGELLKEAEELLGLGHRLFRLCLPRYFCPLYVGGSEPELEMASFVGLQLYPLDTISTCEVFYGKLLSLTCPI